jgi:hypothetical protein
LHDQLDGHSNWSGYWNSNWSRDASYNNSCWRCRRCKSDTIEKISIE